MKFLPFENITYKSRLSQEEVLKKLNEIMDTETVSTVFGIFSKNSASKAFKGTIDGNSFQMTRVISYRNSFLPVITGVIEKDFGHSNIYVKMKPALFVIIFMSIWLGFVGVMAIGFLASMTNSHKFEPTALVPIGMFIFGIALIVGGFKAESIPTKKRLAKIFEASIEQE